MLKYQKRIINNLLELLNQAHGELEMQLTNKQISELPELLQLCQGFMIRIGGIIEESEGEDYAVIHKMEAYCEVVYILSQILELPEQWNENLEELKDLFDIIRKEIEKIPLKKEIVFFPYNAAMWDCLESIWLAADRDPESEAYVIPIPYYELNAQEKSVTEKYDGEKFPSCVPITDYRSYDLKEHRPDIAYIHNPFDQFNNVTSVHPDYYSYELKKYIARVVYVPYFITAGAVFYSHRDLPSYYHVDFIIAQSQSMIESFASTIPKKKFLAAGSPIIDRIINLSKNKPAIPDDWKPMLPNGTDFGEKKTVMYNTSLSTILDGPENSLKKIKAILKVFSEIRNVIVIWRPHPLMYAALQTKDNSLLQKYITIEQWFCESKIGVLDKTSDIGVSVSLCDAYIGEISSVVHMFEITGKPRFYVNLRIENNFKHGNIYGITALNHYAEDDIDYFLSEEYYCLFKKDRKSGIIELLDKLPGAKKYPQKAYKDIYKYGNNIYLQPFKGQGLYIYNICNKSFRKFYVRNSVNDGFKAMVPWDGGLYLVPHNYPVYVKFDLQEEKFIYIESKEEKNLECILLSEQVKQDEKEIFYEIPADLIQRLKAQEIFSKMNNRAIEEDEENGLQDFLYLVMNDKLFWKKEHQYALENIKVTENSGERIHDFIKSTLEG